MKLKQLLLAGHTSGLKTSHFVDKSQGPRQQIIAVTNCCKPSTGSKIQMNPNQEFAIQPVKLKLSFLQLPTQIKIQKKTQIKKKSQKKKL